MVTEKQAGRIVVAATGGPVGIVAEAWDQVDGNAVRRRLGLYRAGFQILKADGTPAPGFAQPRITIQFNRMPIGADAVKIVYAPASGDTVHSDQRTRFQYVVTNMALDGRTAPGGWDPKSLPPGDYIVRIHAADMAGNAALANRDLPITIR